MFLGTYDHTVDQKGRMFLPAKFREGLGSRMYAVKAFDRLALAVYPAAEWERFVARIESLPQVQAREVRRFVFSSAAELEADGQGRINLPQNLREYAKLEKEVKVTGNNSFIELWSESGYTAMTENVDTEALTKQLIDLGF